MTENERKPAIRFAGFTDAWEQRKLGNVVDVCNGRDYKHLKEGNVPVYGTGGYILSVSEALSENKDAIGIGRKGTIDKPFVLKAPFWTVDTLFYCIPKEDYDLSFVSAVYQNVNWKAMDESTGVPSLSKTAINNVELLAPKFEEQKKLGDFFDNLDSLITLHQRKCEKLQEMKKGLLQKMFPKNGSDTPEIRFAGYSDAWEQRKLGSITKQAISGGTPHTNVPEYWVGQIPWFQSADFIQDQLFDPSPKKLISEKAVKESSTKLIPANSIAIVTRVGVGKLAFIKHSYCTSQDFVSLVGLNINALFAAYAIYKKVNEDSRKVQGTSIKGVTKDELLNKTITVCNNDDEQSKIGQFFSTLDSLINLHQRKCEKLKNIKKSLLEKMFA